MTRRPSLQGPFFAFLLFCWGASFVGIAAPQRTPEPGSPGIPTARSLPWEVETPVSAASGNVAQGSSGAPTPKPSERPKGSAAATTAGPVRVPRPAASAAPAKSRATPSRKPQVARKAAGRVVSGNASWYCLSGRSACTRGYGPECLCAAAGPAVRAALGDWRGRLVTVSTSRASVTLRLVDFCSCPGGRVLDLYASVMGGLGVPLSAGVVDVEVSWT